LNSTDLVLRLIDALDHAGVPYMLVGSYSSNYYGRPRSTKDADFVLQITNEQLARVASELGDEFHVDRQMSFETITFTSRYIINHPSSAFKIELFPTSSYVPLTEDPLRWASHLILPWLTLAVLYVGFYSRVLRSNMLDVMNEDYVRTARAKGVSERQVRIRHVLRNSMIPIITLFGLDFGAVVGGGAILTETVFNINGVGLYAGRAIGSLDLPPLMGVTMFGAFFIVLFNTIVDTLYAYLDPRIRLGEAAPA